MGKPRETSGNGPDWTDIAVYLNEVQTTHQCTLSLDIQPVGRRDGHRLSVSLVASWVDLTVQGGMAAELFGSYFPTSENRTMEGLVYRLCHQMDKKLSVTRWYQSSFEGKAPPA